MEREFVPSKTLAQYIQTTELVTPPIFFSLFSVVVGRITRACFMPTLGCL